MKGESVLASESLLRRVAATLGYDIVEDYKYVATKTSGVYQRTKFWYARGLKGRIELFSAKDLRAMDDQTLQQTLTNLLS